MKQLLKDVIAVKHLTAPIQSSVLLIPETAKDNRRVSLVEAEVLYIGSKCKLDIKLHDTVLVPYHLGNRMEINKQKMIFYDSEDVVAIVEKP